MQEFIILDSEKVIDYDYQLSSRGIFVQVFQPLTDDEKLEFESKLKERRDVVRIDFDVCDRCHGSGKEDADIWNDDAHQNEPTGSKVCTQCEGSGIYKFN